jgi:hypothetical protein
VKLISHLEIIMSEIRNRSDNTFTLLVKYYGNTGRGGRGGSNTFLECVVIEAKSLFAAKKAVKELYAAHRVVGVEVLA